MGQWGGDHNPSFLVYQELWFGFLGFARVSESCVDMISEMCTFKGIAGSVSLVVNKRPNLPFQNRDRCSFLRRPFRHHGDSL